MAVVVNPGLDRSGSVGAHSNELCLAFSSRLYPSAHTQLRHHWASRQDTPWTECQPIAGHTHTLIHTHYEQFRDANQPTMHVFGLGEETPEAQGEHANSTHSAGRN
ncbi:hypothetical protein QTP70_014708 [Hemibagrus guttatus]|uniref:Uncharacterized protein n=1 Tax=Hemibagrus guttatus TaxID=175788 RepID=A0AAE0UX96_9TELE|nr:hypothetical protein QTP70_014708 [Hemibagrus guttatus]